MAEHTLAMILALAKFLVPRHNEMQHGKFNQITPTDYLSNSVCGIVGFGGIGKATAKLLRVFGCKIIALNTSGKTEEEVDFIGTLNDKDYLLKNSDVVIVSIPLNEKTKDLISKRELDLMKKDAILINVARGAILNEKDLFNHLKENPNFRVGIDAWWTEPFKDGEFILEYPFFDLPNFLGSPHNSAVAKGALFDGFTYALDNIERFLNGEQINGEIKRSDK